MKAAAYRELTRIARRYSRRADEAEDLVQEALLEAVRVGRSDLDDSETRRWLHGVIRHKARLTARTAMRRRARDNRWHVEARDSTGASETLNVEAVLAGLPPALKSVAALALTGHSRREIAYLLRVTDTALRQRVVMLKRELRRRGIPLPEATPGLRLDLDYGRIRDALLPMLVERGGLFASHDPDGHPFLVRRAHIPPSGGN